MQRGFSLVELSIVLVILGLLTGGILAGQSLIRASELRAVTSEYQRYVAATQTFRDKYFAISGDFNGATRFWGRLNTNADCVSTHGLAVAAAPGACDGDASGANIAAVAAGQSGERFQFWRHLALAGLIEGNYSGLAGPLSGADHVLVTNVPPSKMTPAGWTATSPGVFAGDANAYAGDYGNAFLFGTKNTGTGGMNAAAIKPEEAWNIDTKLDDGKPAYGRVLARFWNNLCATGGVSETDLAPSIYNLTNNSIQCAMFFTKQY